MCAVDLSAELGTVRDQGPRGTCLAFAVTAGHEQARVRRRGAPRQQLTEELLYWASKQVDGDRFPGTSPASAAHALHDTGQPRAHLWPYDIARDDGDASYAAPAEALAEEVLRKATLRETAGDVDALRDLLRGGRVVVLALELWDQFYAAHGGDLGVPTAGDLLDETHAVTLVGFDDHAQEFWLRNSWGEDWGADGHGRLAYAAVNLACRGAWVVEDDLGD